MSDTQSFNSFSTNQGSFGTKEFLDSNSLVAKFAFLLLVIVVFMILLSIGINLISRLFSPNDSPKLIKGMVDAKQMITFPQDPNMSGANTINRSIDASQGIEFTWSVWIYINNLQYLSNQYKHIFHKGNSGLVNNGLNFPNNAPGVYLMPETNTIVIMMNTYNDISQEIKIPDIPINKWVNIIIRCHNKVLDVYINGTITRSITLSGVPKQNYGDVFVAMNGGFDGYISNLWYYNYALGSADIQSLVRKGPNTNMVNSGESSIDLKNPDYLSLRWYFNGAGNMFMPPGPHISETAAAKGGVISPLV
jgi:hypothetical protein